MFETVEWAKKPRPCNKLDLKTHPSSRTGYMSLLVRMAHHIIELGSDFLHRNNYPNCRGQAALLLQDALF